MKKYFFKQFTLALLFFPSLCVAKDWAFDVLMDGDLIGEHTFNLKEEGEFHQLLSNANFTVTLLSIPIYKYNHSSKELWSKDCLRTIEASTQDGGDQYKVLGKSEANIFKLIEPSKEAFSAECPMTFSYWNPIMLLQSKLLNVQTGEYTEVQIKSLGREIVKVRNENIEVDLYQLTGPKINIRLWYNDNKEWVKLESITPNDKHISYILR